MNALKEPLTHCFLSQLLPYEPKDKTKDFDKRLREHQLLITATEQALDALKLGELENFDPIVGENACQIRAVKIALIAMQALNTPIRLKTDITNIKKRIEHLSPSIHLFIKKGMTFQDLLDKQQLDINLTEEEFFVIQSYLLTLVKVSKEPKETAPLCINEITDTKKLNILGNVSSCFKDNLARKLRQLLSAASVLFVQKKAKELQDHHLIKMTSSSFIVNYNSWLCSPMFWTYKTLLLTAQKEHIPIVLRNKFLDKNYHVLDEDHFIFQSDSTKENKSSYGNTSEKNVNKIAFVIQGVTCVTQTSPLCKAKWKDKIAKLKLDVILAGAADHRQYPNLKNDELIESLEDSEYKNYKAMAKKEGCSLENPGTFFIQHAYADKLDHRRSYAMASKSKVISPKLERKNWFNCVTPMIT